MRRLLGVLLACASVSAQAQTLSGPPSPTTGSGSYVLSTSPTLVTPLLGTPTSGVATNLTGTAAGLTAGTVTTNANLTGDVTSSGNATTMAASIAGTKTFSGQLIGKGTATNDSAATGYIGETLIGTVLVGSPTALTTNTTANLTSLSLPAGDYLVFGNANYVTAATTNVTSIDASISLVSATLDTAADRYHAHSFGASGLVAGSGFPESLPITPARISLASTTTVYFAVRANFTVSTLSVWGYFQVERIR